MNNNHLSKKTKSKIKSREKKRRKKMGVTGKGVFEIKQIIDKKTKKR
ncbi:hypothetical protein ACFL2B_02955 [Patescibacteria group bacterium]